jgi:hypothetical protein
MAKTSKGPPNPPPITIDGSYHCDPPDQPIGNGEQVNFIVAPNNGCFVYTDPPQAFVGETSGHLVLKKGNQNMYAAAVRDTTIYYCACPTNGTCDPHKAIRPGGYTIKVGNPPIERRRK